MRPLTLLALTSLFTACSEVRIVPNDDGETSVAPACDPDRPVTIRHEISGVRSASLIGGVLHADGLLDGGAAYAVIDLSGDPHDAALIETREDLAGEAGWIPVYGPYHARVMDGAIQVLDATTPEHALAISSSVLGGEVPTGFARAFGAAGNGFFVCVTPDTPENAAVVRFDLTDPHHPSAPEARPDAYCDGWFGHSGTAQGSLWLVWGTTEPSYHTDGVLQQDLGAPEGEANIDSHGFAVDGVHHYGYIRELESDGEISVATLDNANYVFVYYRSSAAHVVYSSFGPGAKKLLAVSDGLAVVARETTDAKVISFYDVHDAANVVELDAHVTLTGATGALDDLRALAKDDAKVIVADADGALFDVVVGADGPTDPIAPTEVISGADACSGNE